MRSFITDVYRTNRGGWSRFYAIFCIGCGRLLFYYQKDGPGPLKRCYIDRIVRYVPSLDRREYYMCPHCKVCLGFYEPYVKEANRPAIRWAVMAVKYNIISALHIPHPDRDM